MRSAATLTLDLGRSRALPIALAAVAAAALAAPWLADLSLAWRVVLDLAAAAIAIRAAGSLRRAPTGALHLGADGLVRVPGASADRSSRLVDGTLAAVLAVLVLRDDGGRRQRLLVARDALDPGDWRQLRVYLRHGRTQRHAGTAPRAP